MKNTVLFLVLTFICGSVYAQVPASFNYQAVVRNGSGVAIGNANAAFQFRILTSNNPNSVALYTEIQNATTDATGLVALKIGQGRVTVGTNLANINWSTSTGSKYLQVDIDPTGGTNYALTSISELISVPYALFAQKTIEDNDKQTLSSNGASVTISNGNTINLPVQNLTLNGTTLSITGGNSVTLPTPTSTQNLTLNGTTLGITGGNSVTLPTGNNYTAGDGIGISQNKITNTSPSKWTTVSNGITYTGGRVGIGTTQTLEFPLTVNGTIKSQIETDPNYAAYYARFYWKMDYKNVQKISADVFDDSLGGISTYGLNGSFCRFSRLTNYGNNPYIALNNVTSVNNVPKVGIYIDQNGKGQVAITENAYLVAGFYYDNALSKWTAYANLKSFHEPHPTQPEKEIWYACIEGREAAMYVRGTARLVDGKATIEFPEDFSLMALLEGMTAMTTPNSENSKGLAVIHKTTTGFEVKELGNGTGNYTFDWEVKAIRKGYEKFQVIRDRMKGDAIAEPKMLDNKKR